jgi:hypothetical protein
MVSSKRFKCSLKKDLFLQQGEESPQDISIAIRYKYLNSSTGSYSGICNFRRHPYFKDECIISFLSFLYLIIFYWHFMFRRTVISKNRRTL